MTKQTLTAIWSTVGLGLTCVAGHVVFDRSARSGSRGSCVLRCNNDDCEVVAVASWSFVTGKDWPNVEYRFRTGEVSGAPGVWGPWFGSRIEQALN